MRSVAGVTTGVDATLALRLHEQSSNEEKADVLRGKHVGPESPFKTPADYPSLAGKYKPVLDYEGKGDVATIARGIHTMLAQRARPKMPWTTYAATSGMSPRSRCRVMPTAASRAANVSTMIASMICQS